MKNEVLKVMDFKNSTIAVRKAISKEVVSTDAEGEQLQMFINDMS